LYLTNFAALASLHAPDGLLTAWKVKPEAPVALNALRKLLLA